MNIAKIIGENIQQLMKENNDTAIELSKTIGVTRQTFANYLTGESVIDSEKLAILSKYFNKPFEYFLESEHNNLSFMFRATNPKENISESIKSAIEKYMDNYYELCKLMGEQIAYIPEQYNLTIKYNSKNVSTDDIDLNFKLFDYKLPKELDKIIENIAYDQRKKLGCEEAVGTELVKTLEDAGIRILFKEISSDDFFGMSALHPDKGCFILVNDSKDIPQERQLFTLAHEYGHLILHRNYYSSESNTEYYGGKKSIQELMADAFAGYFLIPHYLLRKHEKLFNKDTISISDLIFVKSEFNVSLMSLVMTLYKYGYISDFVKRSIFETLYKKGYGKKEPFSNCNIKKNEKYNFMVKSLFLKDEITISKTADLLNIGMNEARSITKEWRNNEEEIFVTK